MVKAISTSLCSEKNNHHRYFSFIKRRGLEAPFHLSPSHHSPKARRREPRMATLRYPIESIRRITEDGIYYVDDNGSGCFIDFAVCRRNFQRKERDASARYVGYRAKDADPPYFTFCTDPPTTFQFPPFVTPPLSTLSPDDDPDRVCEWHPEAELQWDEFLMQLRQVNADTIDLS
jgi:hypothetical protein